MSEQDIDQQLDAALNQANVRTPANDVSEMDQFILNNPVELTGEENVFLTNLASGIKAPAQGALRVFGKLLSQYGPEGAEKYLANFERDIKTQEARRRAISKGSPGQAMAGTVLGETIGFPIGGGVGGPLVSAFKAFVANAAGGGLTSFGRGASEEEATTDALISGGLGTTLDLAGTAAKSMVRGRRQQEIAGRKTQKLTQVTDESMQKQIARSQEVMEGEKELGIDLFGPQRTQDPYLLRAQELIGELPQSGVIAYDSLRRQNEQASSAVINLLGRLGTDEAAGYAGARVSKLAEGIISNAQLGRTQATHPIFLKAFDDAKGTENPFIPDLSKVKNIADDILIDAPETGKIASSVGKIANQLGLADENADPKSLKALHLVKIEIDEMLEAQGDESVGKIIGAVLGDMKSALLDTMQAYPGYKQGMDLFRQMSPAINRLEEGKIGQLANLDPQQYKNVSKILFDAAETNPEVTKQAIRTLQSVDVLPGYSGVGSQIVRDLLVSELRRRMGKMRTNVFDPTVSMGLRMENVPAQLKTAIFGNASQREVLFTALRETDPKSVKNFVWLEKILDRASSGRPGGSQTAIRQVVLEKMKNLGTSVIRNIFRRPIETTAGIGEEAIIDARIEAFGDALFDPDYSKEMAKIRKLGPEKGLKTFDTLTAKVLDINLNRYGTMTRAATVGAMSEEETADFYYDPEDDQIHSNGMQ
jgi:hypothetical protein